MRRGNLFVMSAPSGSGKTTLRQQLLSRLEDVIFSVSYTTRQQRPGEKDGSDYHFICREEFEAKIGRNEFLEWAKVHDHLYGTGRAETEVVRNEGKDILLDLDVQGADQVRRAQPEAVTIFVLPPSLKVLEQRLRGRRRDEPHEIEQRLATARREVSRYREYHYVIVNDDIERSAQLLQAIVVAERARPHLMDDEIQSVLKSFEDAP